MIALRMWQNQLPENLTPDPDFKNPNLYQIFNP